MNIEKLPSGSYRIRQLFEGKKYSVTVKQKPTKKEAIEIMAELLKKAPVASQGSLPKEFMTFREAMTKYNSLKEPVLSPSTIKDYNSMLNRVSEEFLAMRLIDIDATELQKEINRYTPGHTSKTVKNFNGYIQKVIKTFRKDFNGVQVDIRPTLPPNPYIPTIEEIKKVVAASNGTKYEIMIGLACYGMRRSEMLAITPSDLDGCYLTIDKAMVQNKERQWVIKDYPKAKDSYRVIKINQELADMIREKGKTFEAYPGKTLEWLHKTCDELGIQRFSLHKIRHYVATELAQAGVEEADILKILGWSKDGKTFRNVYRHSRYGSNQETIDNVGSKLDALSFNI